MVRSCQILKSNLGICALWADAHKILYLHQLNNYVSNYILYSSHLNTTERNKSNINKGFTVTVLDCNGLGAGQTSHSLGCLKESLSHLLEKTIALFYQNSRVICSFQVDLFC